MPPKRGRAGARGGARAGSRARGTPGPSEASREATPVFDSPMIRSRGTPGPPARFSSSYGSPAVLTSSRAYGVRNVAGAVGAVLRTVQDANDADSQASRDAPGSEDEDEDDDEDEDEDARTMPPPPLPRQRATRGRFESEPPASDAMSQRSFIEESQLYGSADVRTPRSAARTQKSPIRTSARIASRNSVARDDTVPPSPSKAPTGASSRFRNPPLTSDSLDEDDEEDPLSNPSPRGIRRNNRASSVPQQPQQPPRRLDRPNPLHDVRSGSVALPRPDHNDPQSRSGNASGNEALSGAVVNGAPRQPARPGPLHPLGNSVLFKPVANGVPKPPAGPALSNASGNDILSKSQGSVAQSNLTNRISPNVQSSRQDESSSPAIPSNIGPNPTDDSRHRSPAESLDDSSDFGDEESMASIAANAFLNFFRVNKWPRWLRNALQIWAMLTFLCWFWLFLLELFMPLDRWEGVRAGKNYTLHGLSFWRQNIAQIVPWIVLHPLAVLTGNLNYADFRNTLHWLEINSQHNKIRMDFLAGATYQMRRVLPELIAVKVDRVSDQWSVEDTFWHALDEQMKQGGLMYSLLTLEKSEDGIYTISDPHWGAIRQRIENDGMLISDRPAIGGSDNPLSDEIITYVDQSVSRAWEDWIKENENAIKRVTRPEKSDPSPVHQDLYGDVERAVSQRMKEMGLDEQIITREEFIEEIQHQSNQYAAQIRTEMDTIQDRLARALEIAEKAKEAADVPPGMSRAEAKQMIDEVVRRSIADAQLEAIAKGNIKSNLDTELVRRKDYFSPLRGAIIDQTLTSLSYGYSNSVRGQDATRPRRWLSWLKQGQKVSREGGKDSGVTFSAGMALERWEEDGECWCAALGDADNLSSAADLSIMTADTIVPQHLVVEHIASEGSFDPGAMPKDIEVWIRAPTDKRRRTLEHWSAQRWPDAQRGRGGLPDRGFVKVGGFTYDKDAKGERQVLRLSEDLLQYDAQTRQVLVRAKTNYGAADHTCFYRLRLFGEEGRGRDHSVLN